MAAQPTTAPSNFDKILNRVQGLLAQAASTTFPAEADAFRAKADELMTAYAIEEWQLRRKAQAAAMLAVKDEMNLDWYWEVTDQEISQAIYSVLWAVASHVRVELAYLDTDYRNKLMPVVGMPHDISYFKLLFTDLFRQMVDEMDPHPRPNEPMIEALVRMKEAGMKWEDIFERLRQYEYYPPEMQWNPSKMNYAGKYTDYCMSHYRERVRTTPTVYRRSFCRGFVHGLATKLSEQREEQGQNTGSRALALRDYRQEVTDALYEFFPKHAPQEPSAAPSQGSGKARRPRKIPQKAFSQEAARRGMQAGQDVTIVDRYDASRQRVAGELE